MKISVTRAILLMATPFTFSVISCQKKVKGDDVTPPGAPSPVELRFQHVVNSTKDMSFDSTYIGPGLTFFKVTEFKYYISNVWFVNETTGDTVKIPETYFLIDERNANSKKPTLTVPAGEYYAMSFLIGIDSARNVSGAQTGALDPANGMFWDRNNGYIMGKFEGTSPSSPLPGNVFTYHVGGYKEPYNVISRRHFKLGGTVSISPGKKTVINFRTDARTWLSNPNTILFSTDPSSTTPGPLAKKIAENYYKMFEFVSVKFE